MDAAQRKAVKITCPVCQQQLDVTDQQPFEVVPCPKCGEKLLVPMQLGNYRLLSIVGDGGMGTVYKAVDLSLGRQVAVKLLRKDLAQDPRFVQIFHREARAAASLNHHNIATLYSTGVQDGQYYLVMELVDGESLDDRITKRKRIPEAEALDIGIQVASGLRHAYQRGLIHRDIKPGNILFAEDGTPKIVDFGLAEFHTDQDVKKPEQEGIWGTPYYIAPEKVAGEKEDFRSDIYSLGGTLFHALAGRAPFEANTATDVVLKHLNSPALSLKTFAPDIRDETAQTVGRMLRKNRAERYSSYDVLIRDLEKAKENLIKLGVHRVSEDTKKAVRKSVRRGVVIVTVVIVLIVACVIGLWTQRDQIFPKQEEAPSPEELAAVDTAPRFPPAKWAAPWVWVSATSSLNQGNYAAAVAKYRQVLSKMDEADSFRPYVLLQIGVSAMLGGSTSNAIAAYSSLIPTNAEPLTAASMIAPEEVPTAIAQVMTDQAKPEVLVSKLSSFPDHAGVLARFHLAAWSLVHGQFADAQKFFESYVAKPQPDPPWDWTTAFSSYLAPKLALECETFVKQFPEVERLQKKGDYENALSWLQSLRTSVEHPVFVAKLKETEEALRKELTAVVEERKRVEEER